MSVNLDQLDLKLRSGVRRPTVHDRPDMGGDQTANFEKSEAQVFGVALSTKEWRETQGEE
jgi:hypothetical protein